MKKLIEQLLISISSAILAYIIFAAAGAFLEACNYWFFKPSGWPWNAMIGDAVSSGHRTGLVGGTLVLAMGLIKAILIKRENIEEEIDIILVVFMAVFLFVPVSISIFRSTSFPQPMYFFGMALLIVGLLVPAVTIAHETWVRRKNSLALMPVGIITDFQRNELPALRWSQLVAGDGTIASDDARGRFQLYLSIIALSAFAGFWFGDFEAMIFAAVTTAWLGTFSLRGATSFNMQGQVVPHVSTGRERREETTPMSRREDCEAFLEVANGQIWFCIGRGDQKNGALPIVERVPWDSFANFEEGSHAKWFRAKVEPSEIIDWGVIVAQSSVGQVVRVAESLSEHAWLVELLGRLQTTFIQTRPAALSKFKAQQEHSPANASSPTNEAPARLF